MIFQSLKMAWASIISNKMRSFLTMLGIIIGVFALVVLVSLVNGATATVTDSISGLGSNMLSVSVSDDKGNPIKLSDLSDIAENEEINEVAPLAQASVEASSTYTEETATVYGTTGAYFTIQGLELGSGRLLKSVDDDNNSNVAVINADLAIDVLGRSDVVGESIKLGGTSFLVVGVLAEEDDSSSMMSLGGSNYSAYIPYTSLIRLQDGVTSSVTSFYVSATNEETLDDAEAELSSMMMSRFDQDEEAFTIINQSAIMDVMSTVTGTFSLLLGGIAAISLLVGGIGIMNIMLVSVTERTREIGIRKAIGAGRITIMTQFLIEALVVSIIGCVIGIVFSWAAMQIINLAGGVNFGLSETAVAIAVVFSIFIGLVFGLYPANKAAKKNPIEALRYTG